MAARQYVPRATRYAIPLAVFYRRPGDSTWAEGRTENISTSGVLIRGDRAMRPDTPVEMLLNIPSDLKTPYTGTTICKGRIVRSVSSTVLEDRPVFAASISEFETQVFTDPRRS